MLWVPTSSALQSWATSFSPVRKMECQAVIKLVQRCIKGAGAGIWTTQSDYGGFFFSLPILIPVTLITYFPSFDWHCMKIFCPIPLKEAFLFKEKDGLWARGLQFESFPCLSDLLDFKKIICLFDKAFRHWQRPKRIADQHPHCFLACTLASALTELSLAP